MVRTYTFGDAAFPSAACTAEEDVEGAHSLHLGYGAISLPI